MKKLSLVFLLLCLSLAGYSQTAASYGFTATTGAFEDISATGTYVGDVVGDDISATSIPIGFSFTFCGVPYTQLSACSNGWLAFSNYYGSGSISRNPTTGNLGTIASGQGMLMAYWYDLNAFSGSGAAYYQTLGTSPNQRFIFEWKGFNYYYSSGYQDFEIILYEGSNQIDYVYTNGAFPSGAAAIGIGTSSTDYQTLSDVSSAPSTSSTSFYTTISGSPADGQIYRWTPPLPCSGAITAGIAHANVITACATDNVTLNLTGTTAATGLSYQWQYYDGSLGVWTNFAGATTNPATVNIATDATVRALVTCDASGYVDSSSTVDVAFSDVCFCTPSYINVPPIYPYGNGNLDTFRVNGYSGSSIEDAGPAVVPSSGFEDRTDHVVAFQQGETYTGVVTYVSGSYGGCETQVWIDFNDDGVFDPAEAVTGVVYTSDGSYSSDLSVSIPLTAPTGSHRMRVRYVYLNYNSPSTYINPCSYSDLSSPYNTYYYGVVRDYYANILAAPSCSGTPDAGTATASTGYGCSGSPFTLTATGYTVATGLSLQWRTSTDGSTWTDIPGATTTTYDMTPTGAAYYQFAVTCTASAQTDTTNSVFVNFLGACPCIPTYSSGTATTSSYGLSYVDLPGEGSTSISDPGPAVIPASGYQDRTSLPPVDLQQGNTYNGTLSYMSYSWDNFNQIWIDFNDDGNFDASEAVTGVIGSDSYLGSDNFSMSIPLSAATGLHRMRVRNLANFYTYPMPPSAVDPCADHDASYYYYYNGTTRDYIVNIIAAPACAGTPEAGVAVASTAFACPSATVALSATGYTVATGLTFQWYSSTTGATGSWTAISGATDAAYDATTTGEIFYQLAVTCTASGEFDTTNAVHVGFFSSCVCTPSYGDFPSTGTYYGLHNVLLTGYAGSTINDDGPAVVPGSGYEDRTSISIDLQQGNSYNGTLTYNGYSYDNHNQIWIDFNDDGVFDVSEQLTPMFGSSSGASYHDFTMTIPLTATVGMHRMRVRNLSGYWHALEVDPCASYDGDGYTYWDGMTRDYIANIIAIPDCSGAPTMGVATATPSSGGETTMFTITAPGTVLAAGVTYQWQSSPDATTWTNIPGATDMSYSFIGLSADTYYLLVGTCTLSTGSTASSTVAPVTYVPAPPCTSESASWTVMDYGGPAPDYGVDAFNVNGFSGTSIADAGIQSVADASTGYLDRTTTLAPVTFEQGLSYASSATWSPVSYHQELQVWIDFNDNGLFEVSEEVSPVSGFSNSSTPNPTLFNISIPASATLGLHKMRLRGIWEENSTSLNDTPAHLDPCGHNFYGTAPNYWSGVVVDYQVNIVPPCLATGTASNAGPVCPNTPISLIGTIGGTTTTYSWSGPGGFTSTELNPTAPGATVAGVYTLTVSDGSCTVTSTTTQSILPTALPPVISPAPATVCNGGVLTLTATVPPTPATPLFEDFNTGLDGWSVDSTGTVYDPFSSTVPIQWTTEPDGYVYPPGSSFGTTFHSPDNTAFAFSTPDAGGSGSTMVSTLTSPTFSLAGMASATLSFQTVYQWYSGDYTAAVEISTDGGSTWSTIDDYRADGFTVGGATYFATESYDLSAYLGNANCKLRFNYNSAWGIYWGLDNVVINAMPSVGDAPVWAPTTALYSDPGLTTPYTGTAQYEVYMHPSVSATTVTDYTATVSLGTCLSKDTTTVTVNYVSPVVAGGSTTICAGNSLSLTNADAGGTWSLSNNTVANITTGGVVTGLASGVDTAYYTVGGCSSYIVINVSTVAPTISGTMALCTGGLTSTLTATGGAGTWSGGSASVATVDAGGMVTSAGVGSTIITYTLASGCSDTALFTVQAPPAAITGTASVCYAGGQTTLSDATAGGTWSISSGGVATITSGGVVTGLTGGSATVTYTTLPNCYATQALTLNAYPSPITGASTVCTGFSTSLSDLTGSGTWSTSVGGPATVDASGNVTGVSAGNATITYTGSNGCAVTTVVTVNSSPSAITGTASVCYVGGQTTLSSSPLGGTWSSSAGTVATVTSGGVVTALSGGAATITYTSPLNSCYATRTLTLNPNPNPIGGVGTVCAGGGTITLTESSGSGTWTSGSTSIATVTSSGMVTGVSAGNAIITFTDTNNCRATATVTVNALPAAITGTTTICNLASTTLADASTPGTWSTTTPTITTVNASGVVTGVSAGIGTIVFTQTSTGCSRSVNVTVNGLPTSITPGSTAICAGTTTTVTGLPGSGTWSASPSTVATVSGAGVVGGVGAGTATITYTNGSGCYITTTLTVNPSFVPSVAINATPGTTLCEGTPASYFATITNGGTAPTYAWTVNGSPVSTASSYGYTPVNGDVVGLTITSNLACAIPTTASTTVTMTVDPIVYPSLTINGTHNDTSCAGSPVVINTFPSAASISPTYQWYVNGTPTATGSSYSYTATDGDVVVAVMTAGASCLSGSSTYTAADTIIMDVVPVVTPEVALSSSTGAVACAGNIVAYLATPTNGGSAPSYLWTVNGINVATGPGYFYTPNNGDVVVVTMTSSYLCVSPATDTAMMTMSVLTGASPVVVITTTLSGAAYSGITDTFTVNIVSGGGTAPTYQWFVNGIAVTGETGPTYVTNMLSSGDVVTCHVTNGDPCGGVTISNAITTVAGVGVNQVTQAQGSIEMMPNPNNGSFVVKGNLGVAVSEDMILEVTDMVGQIVYTGHTQAKSGAFSEQVQLSGLLANGMYILNVRSQHMQKQFHFVLNQQ